MLGGAFSDIVELTEIVMEMTFICGNGAPTELFALRRLEESTLEVI